MSAYLKRWFNLSSVRPLSDKFRTQMLYSSSPAKAIINEDLPQPGGPYSKYPVSN